MQRLPEQLIPELRAKWIKTAGAREVVQHAAARMQAIEGEYQNTLNVCLRVMGLDPTKNYKVNLETGEISEVTAEDVVRQGQMAPDGNGSVPFEVNPSGLSPDVRG